MILGTPRRWWIAAGLLLVLGIGLFATGAGGTLGAVAGVLLLLAAMAVFAAAPMRYGRERPGKAASSANPSAPDTSSVDAAPAVRPAISARDASDV